MKGIHSGKFLIFASITLFITLVGGFWLFYEYEIREQTEDKQVSASAPTSSPIVTAPSESPSTSTSTSTSISTSISTSTPTKKTLSMLVEEYGSLGLTDVHNHDASGLAYQGMLQIWNRTAVKRVVLFGDVSEPSAVVTDLAAWMAYEEHPDFFVPFFAGFDLHSEFSLDLVRTNLEKGYMGLGEIAAASTQSPIVSKVLWKADDPMDGYLPQIYELCAEYKAPILLHIDPPFGLPIEKLKEALAAYPDTTFIFGHINAYNSIDAIDDLMKSYPNLYADFFAGFTELSGGSTNKLKDFIPLIQKFPDRFLLGTDSGYGLASEEAAIESMYRLIDLLEDPELAHKLAHDNFAKLIQDVPATKTQLKAITALEKASGSKLSVDNSLTKLEAGKIIADNKKIPQ